MTSTKFNNLCCLCVLEIQEPVPQPPAPPPTPCVPSCGANSVCKVVQNKGTCMCLSGFYGQPELGCTPECLTNLDCDSHHACINQRCIDPCGNSCGILANCQVLNHIPICSCPDNMIGDPFRICQPAPPGKFHISFS